MSIKNIMRTGETNLFGGAHLRGLPKPRRILVNMGRDQIALGRNSDLFHQAAPEEVKFRKNLRTSDLNALLKMDSRWRKELLGKDDWNVAEVSSSNVNFRVLLPLLPPPPSIIIDKSFRVELAQRGYKIEN